MHTDLIMNISIYYHTKRVDILPKDQNPANQLFKDLGELSPPEIFREFERFIHDREKQVLQFVATTPQSGLERFSKAFKYIEAAGGFIRQDQQYLFIFRMGAWDLPKGKLEKHEAPREAAIRECEEECGITGLSIVRELNPTYHMYEHKKWGYAIKKTFWYLMTSTHAGALVPQTEELIEKAEWLSAEEIKTTVYENTYFAILDVVRDGLQ